MNLLEYIDGNRKGKEAHRIERESMRNPFLNEALEGLENVEGNHVKNIKTLFSAIDQKANKKKFNLSFLFIQKIAAACLVVVIISGIFYFKTNTNNSLQAQNKDSGLIEIYVPAEYYQKNIAVIAQSNSKQARKYRSVIKKNKLETGHTKFESTETEEKTNSDSGSPIDIYMPQ